MPQQHLEPADGDVEMSGVPVKTAQNTDRSGSSEAADNNHNQLHQEDITDLSDIPAKDLHKLPDVGVRPIEAQGQFYADIFRRLQLSPGRYQEFYEGVIRACRQKHWAEVKRGTEKSYRHITALLLRGYGYLVWVPASDWLLPEKELSIGEARLHYHRQATADENEHFYPMFDQLWRRMRNILFAVRPKNFKRGHKSTPSALNGSALVGSDGESAYLGDADTDHYTTPIAPLSPISNFKIQNRRSEYIHLNDSQTLIDATGSSDSLQQLTAAEASEAILDLVRRLSQIRAGTDPTIFATLWEQHIARVEEIENSAVDEEATAIRSIEYDVVQNDKPDVPQNLSNNPWMTIGNPNLPSLRESAMMPPELPTVISVYISSSLSSNNHVQRSHLYQPSQHVVNVYHWPSAPVLETERSMHAFLEGVMLRVSNLSSITAVRLEKALVGWALSYGWNDGGCFIHTGAKQEGWNAFQADLRDAAIRGVRIWRLKVCVVLSRI